MVGRLWVGGMVSGDQIIRPSYWNGYHGICVIGRLWGAHIMGSGLGNGLPGIPWAGSEVCSGMDASYRSNILE